MRFILTALLVGGLVVLGPITARAELVATGTVLQGAERAEDARDRLHAGLGREDVRLELQRLGVGANEAHARVDALSDAELVAIHGELDALPAGGSVVGAFLGAALVVFLVLLFTDIVGLTDVFPFVRKPARR